MNFDNPIYKRTTEDKLELPRHEYQPSQTEPSVSLALLCLSHMDGEGSVVVHVVEWLMLDGLSQQRYDDVND